MKNPEKSTRSSSRVVKRERERHCHPTARAPSERHLSSDRSRPLALLEITLY